MSPRRFAAAVLVPLLATGAVLVPGSTAQAKPADGAAVIKATGQRHADVVRYWTSGRVRDAIPADIEIDGNGKRTGGAARPEAGKGKPGSGTGGSGGATSTSGASWTAGGAVLATTGKVLFTLGGSNYVCSGSVVQDGVAGRALALTAGHCVYDDVANSFATNWMFVPAFDTAPTFSCASTVYGCWTATSLVTTSQWANSDFNHDVGFAVLGAGGKTAAHLDDVVGAQPIAFNTVHPTTVYAFGYPAEGTYTGNDLVYCAGTDGPDVWGGSTDYALSCKLNGGSSGGPWFRDFDSQTGTGTLTSVNSFSYRGLKNRMFGPYLGSVAANAYATAVGAGANTLS